jgi:hypothetical protein
MNNLAVRYNEPEIGRTIDSEQPTRELIEICKGALGLDYPHTESKDEIDRYIAFCRACQCQAYSRRVSGLEEKQ